MSYETLPCERPAPTLTAVETTPLTTPVVPPTSFETKPPADFVTILLNLLIFANFSEIIVVGLETDGESNDAAPAALLLLSLLFIVF